ncbi:MAG TPA: hypothetical protein VF422_05130 [Dokdonella sp.]
MAASIPSPRRAAARPILLGGLLIAAGDIAFAISMWFQWDLAGLQRVFQSIAMGVLGRASFEGGLPSALLGAVLHVFIATMFVVAAVLVGRRVPRILQSPYALGPAYGVLLYAVMNFVVMPLSRVGATPSFSRPWPIALSIVAHMVFGVVALVFARRALRADD